jgi:3,4-dihydroxy-2-butanone 4-phosphate synthase
MQLQMRRWTDDLDVDTPREGLRATPLSRALDLFAAGAPVLICDTGAGELLAELCVPAEALTTARSAFLIRHTSGIMTATVDTATVARLDIPLLRVDFDRDAGRFCVAVDATSESTGISARDRARTIVRMADSSSGPDDFDRPGHVVPVLTGGVFAHTRWTRYDAAAALSRRAGLSGVVASAPLVDGLGATVSSFVTSFARTHRLPLLAAGALQAL